MEKLSETFTKCKEENKVAFIPYITAGYPTLKDTVPLMLSLQNSGADIIELGMPFSDPLADGPTIQKSSFIALNNGVTLKDCINYVIEARKQGLTVPVILMGYYNPFMNYGEDKIVIDCKKASISGFIVVDLAPDEPSQIAESCKKHGLSLIPLVAPTSTDKRLKEIKKYASGYVYCVSVTGVTGSRTEVSSELPQFLDRVRSIINLPLAVGFGLSKREHIKNIAKLAEGAVVGSALIKVVEKHSKFPIKENCKAVEDFVQDLTSTD